MWFHFDISLRQRFVLLCPAGKPTPLFILCLKASVCAKIQSLVLWIGNECFRKAVLFYPTSKYKINKYFKVIIVYSNSFIPLLMNLSYIRRYLYHIKVLQTTGKICDTIFFLVFHMLCFNCWPQSWSFSQRSDLFDSWKRQ